MPGLGIDKHRACCIFGSSVADFLHGRKAIIQVFNTQAAFTVKTDNSAHFLMGNWQWRNNWNDRNTGPNDSFRSEIVLIFDGSALGNQRLAVNSIWFALVILSGLSQCDYNDIGFLFLKNLYRLFYQVD